MSCDAVECSDSWDLKLQGCSGLWQALSRGVVRRVGLQSLRMFTNIQRSAAQRPSANKGLNQCQHKIFQEALLTVVHGVPASIPTVVARHRRAACPSQRPTTLLQVASKEDRLLHHHAPEMPGHLDAPLTSIRADHAGPEDIERPTQGTGMLK
jgi:hypothetical protein